VLGNVRERVDFDKTDCGDMENTSLIALSRQGALRRQMAVIANNVANMNTTGFKGDKVMFVEHMVRSKGGERIYGDKIAFVRDIATVRDTSEGPLKTTDNPLDVAIRGEGFLVVQTDQGLRYTRNGRMQLDPSGQLVSQHGYPVLSEDGEPITFATQDKEINISRDGSVSTDSGDLGRLRVVRFANEQNLRITSGGLYSSEEQPEDMVDRDIVQRTLEGSNVVPIIEMARMIEVNRTYDSVSKMIQREDERMKKMIQEYAREA
jgi:flagellar basal-body rod protein FlgF